MVQKKLIRLACLCFSLLVIALSTISHVTTSIASHWINSGYYLLGIFPGAEVINVSLGLSYKDNKLLKDTLDFADIASKVQKQ